MSTSQPELTKSVAAVRRTRALGAQVLADWQAQASACPATSPTGLWVFPGFLILLLLTDLAVGAGPRTGTVLDSSLEQAFCKQEDSFHHGRKKSNCIY